MTKWSNKMNIAIALPALAPQPTGHPASLPADPPPVPPTQRVTAPDLGSQSSGTALNTPSSGKHSKTAPPSVIQMKIMEMLEQQARDLDQVSDNQ